MQCGPGRASDSSGPVAPVVILGLLAGSIVGLAVAPLVLDPSYSSVQHTTSEAAGQRVEGAWVTRSGFLLFGLAVIWLAHRSAGRWRQPATALHVAFGSCLVAVAAFSLRSWEGSRPYDRTEDLLHSIAATVMGFAFALGVAAIGLRRDGTRRRRGLDVVAIAASVAIPVAMAASTDHAGALQRAMFGIAYVWYARETVYDLRTAPRPPRWRRGAGG